jgi:DNA replication and repair protein RecF
VRIRALTLQPFRNFDQIHFSFEGDHILIFGPNGHGKSNILEAISYLSIGKSVRGAKDQQAIPHGGEYFDIRALCDNGRQEQMLRIFYSRKSGKKFFRDEAPMPRVSDMLGLFRTVHFSPEDVSLVLRFPAQRRRLLDILISQSSPRYLRDLQQYQRVLMQRNYLLRSQRKGNIGFHGEQSLEPWSVQLAQLGARLRKQRLEVLGAIAEPFIDYYCRFTSAQEAVAVEYQGFNAKGESEIEAELQEELRRRRYQEKNVGYTLCGPHRDDLVFTLNGQPADPFASEGQLKTILIAWKMAEVRILEQPTGGQPVLLLDDVFSELDQQRLKELQKVIDEFEQALVTSPREPEGKIQERFVQIQLPAVA